MTLTAKTAALKKINNINIHVEKGNKSNDEGNTSAPWKLIAPMEGLPQEKPVGSKTFVWLPHRKYWGYHELFTSFQNKKVATESPIEMFQTKMKQSFS